jgi:cytoskeleton protein RodZ
MTVDDLPPETTAATVASDSAGVLLARGREAAGLSVEGIAQQLKLAPRQIRALEEGDFAALPGRTFVRGFVRNYARLIHLDPQVVLAALPGDGDDPALNRPALGSPMRAMGEIPAEHSSQRPWTRWAIPLALCAIVAVAVAYERFRPMAPVPAVPGPSVPATPDATPRPQGDPASPSSATPLPNPAAAPAGESTTAPTAGMNTPGQDGTGAGGATDSNMPAGGMTSPVPAPAGMQNSSPAPASSAADAVPAAKSADAAAPLLQLTFRGVSWVEVKDEKGTTLLNMTGGPGAAQTLRATPPLDITVGNAGVVDVTFRGSPVDLASYTHQNIARLKLR